MELDGNQVFDQVSAFAPALLIFVTCLTIFYRLRVRWPVNVNCWFCNENSKVWRQHLNWWLCPWCEQYNGFTKNGDYAYDIPDQYATPNKSARYCRLAEQSDVSEKGHLCADCNKRESLKLLELSTFEPKSEKRYNAELKEFKEHLEKRYPLCDKCKSTVRSILRKQALWLTRYKMLFFRQRPIKTLIGNARKSEAIFRAISMVCIPIIVYNHDSAWLPIGGLFFHLCACWASSTRRKGADILLIFLWFCVIILVSIKNSTFLNAWLTMEHIIQYHMITVCALIMGFLNIKPSSYKSTLIGGVTFKKLKLRSRTAVPEPESVRYSKKSKNNISNGTIKAAVESSVCETDEIFCSEIKSHSTILRQKLSTITADNGNGNRPNSVSQNKNSPPDGCCLNQSLSTLFLSEDSLRRDKITSRATPVIFERRVYSATNSENLFKKSGSNRRYVLSPPKLKSLTQTSWVAGGYWQEGNMMTATPPTLSRSSSQSSGFGSAGSSNFAPSREPSVHEFDRCSVVSDVTTRWSCYTPGPTATRNHSPQFQSPSSRAEDVREPNIDSRSSDLTPALPSHHHTTTTTTVVASSGWLSALLCGSLILNMIVLCATLLR